MTGFKTYFGAHLRSNFRPILYILIITLTLTLMLGLTGQPDEDWIYETETLVKDFNSTLYIPVLFMCILSYVLPVMEFSFFKKRRNLDCAYALPISRRCMGAVHYLSGALILIGTFTLSYLLNFALLLTRGATYFNFPPMIAHYFLCAILGLALYSIMVFVFNEANTKGDGIWFMLLWTFVVALVVLAVEELASKYSFFAYGGCAIPWGVINSLTTTYQYIVEMEDLSFAYFWQKPECFVWLFVWCAVGVAAAIGFFLSFGKRRMERTEEISDSFFGFRVMIPVYAVAGMICFGSIEAILWVIIEILALLGYTIYRRGFHYKKSDIIFLVAMIIFLGLGFVN